MPQTIREFEGWWWLRSPGDITDRAAIVYLNGRVNEFGCYVYSDHNSVRPALILNLQSSDSVNDGAKLVVGDYTFTVVCDGKYALCDTPVGRSAFRKDWESPDANDYEVSDIKKFVDDWYQNEIKGNNAVCASNEHSQSVFVYTEYCDEDAFGERLVEVYSDENTARARLKAKVESAYEMDWDQIPEEIGLDEDDTFEPDYVSINNGNGATSFWIIERKNIL